MRIGFDAKRYFFNQTGLGNHNRSVIDNIVKEFGESHEFFLFSPKVRRTDLPRTEVISPTSFLDKKLKSIWRTYKIPKLAEELKLDVYIGLSNELPMGIHKVKGLKKIVVIHDLIFMQHPEQYSRFDQRVHVKKVKYASEVADVIVATSEKTKQDIIDLLGVFSEKIKVVYQDCHPQFKEKVSFKQEEATRIEYKLPKRYLLYVGRIETRKNLHRIVEALPQTEDVDLVVVGKEHGKYPALVHKRVSDLKLEKRVHFLKNVPFETLPVLYQMAEALVYPSLYEGFGIPVLEALHSNIEVVTTKGGCFDEVGRKMVVSVDPYEVQSIADGIDKALTNPPDKSLLGKHLSQFDAVEQARKYIKLF